MRGYEILPLGLMVASVFISGRRKTLISTVSSEPRIYSEGGRFFNFLAMERFCVAILTDLGIEALGGKVVFFTAARSIDRPHPKWAKQKIKEKMIKDKGEKAPYFFILFSSVSCSLAKIGPNITKS